MTPPVKAEPVQRPQPAVKPITTQPVTEPAVSPLPVATTPAQPSAEPTAEDARNAVLSNLIEKKLNQQ